MSYKKCSNKNYPFYGIMSSASIKIATNIGGGGGEETIFENDFTYIFSAKDTYPM